MSCCATPVLSYEEQYCPQYCSLCDQTFFSLELLRNHLNFSGRHPYCHVCHRGYLNHNSFRVHLLVSDYHHFCDICNQEFNSAKALEIHNEQSPYHSRDYEAGDRDPRPAGWENALADEFERQAKIEDVIHENVNALSRVEFGVALLKMKKRQADGSVAQAAAPRRHCPVCLTSSTRMASTRCGHVFCQSCIKQTFEKSQGCPSCRKMGSLGQLRKLQIHSH